MKVEIRKNCKICGKKNGKRFRTFCSATCRNYFFNRKYRPQQKEWQTKQRDKVAEKPSSKKVQCLLCGKWYVQVGTHIFYRHEMTAREYRLGIGK